MQVKGIDISEWQGLLTLEDFIKIKNDGINFIMLRCGYTSYGINKNKRIDRYFENNYRLAKEAGIPVGAYYYSCATTMEESIEEANFTLEIIKDKVFEYPIAVDTEDAHDISNPSNSNISQASIGRIALTPIIKNFCDILEQNNKYVSIYASTYWFRNNLILSDLVEYDKWIAQWSNTVNFEEEYGMWQYSSTGTINGILGNVDLNYSYKDYPTIMKDSGLNGYVKIIETPDEDNPDDDRDDDIPIDDGNQNEVSDSGEIIDKPIIEEINFLKKIFSAIGNFFRRIIDWFTK